jgi:cytosine/uracil/thiamine/allantoin permease
VVSWKFKANDTITQLRTYGVIIAGAASDLYGEEIWDPLTILSRWTGSSGARAGAAFCGLSFTLAQLGSNISANCISAANDLNAMFPAVRGVESIKATEKTC